MFCMRKGKYVDKLHSDGLLQVCTRVYSVKVYAHVQYSRAYFLISQCACGCVFLLCMCVC